MKVLRTPEERFAGVPDFGYQPRYAAVLAAYEAPFPGPSYAAAGRDHPVLKGAGHFLQEDAGAELGAVIASFIQAT